MPRQEYHIAVRADQNDGEDVRVSVMLSRSGRADLPTSTLFFKPARSENSYPVTIYWKSVQPNTAQQRARVEHTVLNYCARLHAETVYEGIIDCCL